MVEVNNIRKQFKLSKKQMKKDETKSNIKVAVNGLSFKAKPGEIFGLLGPNGAGKTTTLRCISTLIKPNEGEVYVMGMNNQTESSKVRGKIAFLTNELKLDEHFTAKDTIQYFGELHGMSLQDIGIRKDELFEHFGIKEFETRKISEFSTGMKQKLSIAVSLIHDPEVVIFDEPTNGLDIITARAVTDYLMKLRNEGKVVIVSTHIMTVASKLCDQIGIILDGEMVLTGSLEHILNETRTEDLEDAFFNLYSEKRG